MNNVQFDLVTTYTLTVTDTLTGCQRTDNVTVTVNRTPAISAGADVSFCSGETVTLGGPSLGIYTFQWLPATGLASPNASSSDLTLIRMGLTDTTYEYVLQTTEIATGCIGFDTVDVLRLGRCLLPMPEPMLLFALTKQLLLEMLLPTLLSPTFGNLPPD